MVYNILYKKLDHIDHEVAENEELIIDYQACLYESQEIAELSKMVREIHNPMPITYSMS